MIDDKKGIPRFLTSLVLFNLILNGLYYFIGPGILVFEADHEKICDFYSKDFHTYYYEPSLEIGDKISVLNDIRSIKLAKQADKSFNISDGVSIFNRACIRADVLRGVKIKTNNTLLWKASQGGGAISSVTLANMLEVWFTKGHTNDVGASS